MERADRLLRHALPVLLLLDVLVLGLVASRPLPLLDNLAIPDDAYLSLKLAQNIAKGLGPLYGIAPTNGFQPLYVFLMVPAFWLWPTELETPVRAALVLLSVFNVATLLVLFRWIQRLTSSTTIAFITGLAWVFNFYVLYDTMNGLETVVSTFFVAASFAVLDRMLRLDRPNSRAAIELGIVLGLAVLARVDNVILVATVLAILAWRFGHDALQPILWLGVVVLSVNVPWLLYSFHYTGEVFPVSGPAVRFRSLANVSHAPTLTNFYIPIMRKAVAAVWEKNTELLCITAGIFVAGSALKVRRSKESEWNPPHAIVLSLLLYPALMGFAYTTYVVAPWYFSRYFFPLVVPLLALFAIGMRRLVDELPTESTRATAVVLCAFALVGLQAARPQFRRAFNSTEANAYGYMNVGLWERANFQVGTRVGSSQTGALAYFAPEVTVINLDGVVNRQGLDALRAHRMMDYVRGSGIHFLVNWERDVQFLLAHSPPEDAENLRDMGPVPGFRSWNQVWHIYEVRPP
jgi:hypothetical protein